MSSSVCSTCIKMLTANPESPVSWAGKFFLIPFFCVHYGMFTFIHGVFVIGQFGGGFKPVPDFPLRKPSGKSRTRIIWVGRSWDWPSAAEFHLPPIISAAVNTSGRASSN